MEQMSVFRNGEFGELGVLEIEGKVYFPATQCARVLGYLNPHKAVNDHCLSSMKRCTNDTLGRQQEMNYITEGDLYRLIVRSKLPLARKFERWVFDEVLPQIRKSGGYGDISKVISEAITLAVGETVRQILPVMAELIRNETRNDISDSAFVRIGRKNAKFFNPYCKIEKLPGNIRGKVIEMLLNNYTYREISEVVYEDCGVLLNATNLSLYFKKLQEINGR